MKTAKKSTFSLQPHYNDAHQRLMGIDFDVFMGDDIFHPVNPVFETLPVKEIDYGKLFTYAFRRFGLPNAGSDSYKEIANWFLKTSNPDLLLIIRPTPLKEPSFSIKFCVPDALAFACHGWERAPVDAWHQRKLDWAEQQGLPEWIPELTADYAANMVPGATWRDLYLGYIIMMEPYPDRIPRGKPELVEFAAKVAMYKEIEPYPSWRKRSPELAQWTDDDPLKPLAYAAIEALADLNTGVRVRDMAINAFGEVADDGEALVVNEPEGAGMTLGYMFNQAPEESVELQIVARKLGDGDFKAGLKRILDLIKTESR